MSKRHKIPPINFQDFKDKLEREGTIPVDMPDGKRYHIKPPELLPDDIFEKVAAGIEDDSVLEAMVDDFAGYLASGGTRILLGAIVQRTAEERSREQGASVGESEASSDS